MGWAGGGIPKYTGLHKSEALGWVRINAFFSLLDCVRALFCDFLHVNFTMHENKIKPADGQ